MPLKLRSGRTTGLPYNLKRARNGENDEWTGRLRKRRNVEAAKKEEVKVHSLALVVIDDDSDEADSGIIDIYADLPDLIAPSDDEYADLPDLIEVDK